MCIRDRVKRLFLLASKTDLNNDLSLTTKVISNNDEILLYIFSSSDINHLAEKMNLTEVQTRFILKSIRSRIDALLSPDIM